MKPKKTPPHVRDGDVMVKRLGLADACCALRPLFELEGRPDVFLFPGPPLFAVDLGGGRAYLPAHALDA